MKLTVTKKSCAPPTRRSPIAASLSAGCYRQRQVEMKTRYSRTLKHKASAVVEKEGTQ
jgi:hypothetical protein